MKIMGCCSANEVVTTTPPKPAGLEPQIFAGRLSVTCVRQLAKKKISLKKKIISANKHSFKKWVAVVLTKR
jgi:hypothetical protein